MRRRPSRVYSWAAIESLTGAVAAASGRGGGGVCVTGGAARAAEATRGLRSGSCGGCCGVGGVCCGRGTKYTCNVSSCCGVSRGGGMYSNRQARKNRMAPVHATAATCGTSASFLRVITMRETDEMRVPTPHTANPGMRRANLAGGATARVCNSLFGWEGQPPFTLRRRLAQANRQCATGRTEGAPVNGFDDSIREAGKRIVGHAIRRPSASAAKTAYPARDPTPPCTSSNADAPSSQHAHRRRIAIRSLAGQRQAHIARRARTAAW